MLALTALAAALFAAGPAAAVVRFGDSGVFSVHRHLAPVDDHGVPLVTAIADVAPNPFNPRTTIAFDLAAAGAARLEIYDISGKLLRVLASADYPAGHQEAIWDGRDDSGHDVATGLYLCRLSAADVVSLRKLTLVR